MFKGSDRDQIPAATTRRILSWIAALLLPCLIARAADEDQILFLHLKLKDGAISLVDSTVRPGRLKPSREPDARGALHLELVTTNGVTCWNVAMPDPAVRRYEYEDPDAPGVLRVRSVQLTETEFTVRAPFHRDATQLRIHRLARPATRAEFLKETVETKWSGTNALAGTGVVP